MNNHDPPGFHIHKTRLDPGDDPKKSDALGTEEAIYITATALKDWSNKWPSK